MRRSRHGCTLALVLAAFVAFASRSDAQVVCGPNGCYMPTRSGPTFTPRYATAQAQPSYQPAVQSCSAPATTGCHKQRFFARLRSRKGCR